MSRRPSLELGDSLSLREPTTPRSTKSNLSNFRAIAEAIDKFKAGIQTALRVFTKQYHLRVVFRGTSAYTTDNVIVLPSVDMLARKTLTDEELTEARAYLMALRGYAWHEALHHTEGDLPLIVSYSKIHGQFFHTMNNAMEDIRIEHRGSLRDKGVGEALEYMRESWLWPRIADETKSKEWYDRSYLTEALLGLQIRVKHPTSFSSHVLWEAFSSPAHSFVRRHKKYVQAVIDALAIVDKTAGTQAVLDASVEFAERVKAEHAEAAKLWPGVNVPEELFVDVVSDEVKYLESLSFEEARKYVESLALEEPLARPRLAGKAVLAVHAVPKKPPPAAAPVNPGEEPAAVPPWPPEPLPKLAPGCSRTYAVRPNEQTVMEIVIVLPGSVLGQAACEALEAMEQEFKILPSDEAPYLVYTTENDLKVETSPASPAEVTAFLSNLNIAYGPVKRRLATLLRTRVRRRWRNNQVDGDDLDMANIAQIVTARRFPNQELRLMRSLEEQDVLDETAVGLLGDVSGSMCGGRRPNRRIDLARIAMHCFAECLEQARIDFAMWVFSSNDNWEEVYLKATEVERQVFSRFGGLYLETAKDFTDRWQRVSNRSPQIGQLNSANYDADSVWWAGMRLYHHKAKRRVLFVFSDGQPTAGEPNLQTARQQRHLSTVVRQLRQLKIEVVGIGIQSHYVHEFYKPQSVVVDTASSLPNVVMSQMEFLLLNQKGNR